VRLSLKDRCSQSDPFGPFKTSGEKARFFQQSFELYEKVGEPENRLEPRNTQNDPKERRWLKAQTGASGPGAKLFFRAVFRVVRVFRG
jgi:hypothetical protein